MDESDSGPIRPQERTLGTWLTIGDPAVAELTAQLAFDFVVVDLEHTPMSLETLANVLRAVDAADGGTQAVVRASWNDPVELKRILDLGVDGIQVPMVETAAAAHEFVDAVRYPPDGSRGIAAGRAADYGLNFEEYVAQADESIQTVAQVETETAVENASAIARVEGIDALFVGPADLSGSLGVFGAESPPELEAAMGEVLDAGAAADTPVGTLVTDPDEIATRLDQGFDFLVVGIDALSLVRAHQEHVGRFEDATEST
jgi:2-keto-3-deoxy-L-rhamnonate aldolase RhmA